MYSKYLILKDSPFVPERLKHIISSASDLSYNLVTDLTWSPDSNKLAVSYKDYLVRIWDIQNQNTQPIHKLVHTKWAVSVTWSPDGKLIASGDTQADPIRIWDTETVEQLQELYGHSSWPFTIDWSPDGHYIVSGGMEENVLLWNTTKWKTYELLYRFEDDPYSNEGYSTTTVQWSKNSKAIAISRDDGYVFCG